MKRNLFVFVLFIGILLSACSPGESLVENSENLDHQSSPAINDPLEGTSWKLLHYRKTQVREGILITADFKDGQVQGSSGCNRYSGSYQIEGRKITIGQTMGTLMACMEPEDVMDMEAMYLAWIQDAQRYEMQGDWLLIYRNDGEALTFEPNT